MLDMRSDICYNVYMPDSELGDNGSGGDYTSVRIRVKTAKMLRVLASLTESSMLDILDGMVSKAYDVEIHGIAENPSLYIERFRENE